MNILTFGLVLVLGYAASHEILMPPQTSAPNLVSMNREPASLKSLESMNLQSDLTKATSVDVGCGSDVELGTLSVAHLRMKSLFCNEGESVEIQNLSNGFTGSAIELKKGFFTSDYIDLSEGLNEIEIFRKSLSGGSIHQKVKVTRRPAQVNEKL